MTETEFANALRSQRTLTAQQVDEIERKRDLRNGIIIPTGNGIARTYGAACH